MATSTASTVSAERGGFPALGSKVGVIENVIDLPTVHAELAPVATADVIEALSLPQGTVVLAAGIEVTETVVGSTVFNVDMGVTGDNVDIWADDVDFGSDSGSPMVVGEYTAIPGGATAPYVIGSGTTGISSDTIDILCNTVTGAPTAGKLRVWAVIADADGLTG